MVDFRHLIVDPETSIYDAMSVINQNTKKMVFVGKGGFLSAALSDGDIRRHLLKGRSLNAPVSDASNKDFKFARECHSPEQCKEILLKNRIGLLPVLDESGRLIDVFELYPERVDKPKPSLALPVVIMAGGQGVRLNPYTKVLPKPLIPIGDFTITERIIHRFLPYSCNNYFLIINHKKNIIKSYFADENPSYNVCFVEEDKPLGTGGGLSLLKGRIRQTFFMTNCDVLIFEEYDKILEHHISEKNLITMVGTAKKVILPYGTLDVGEDGRVMSLTEKPAHSYLINTGLYVIEPEFLKSIPENISVDVTDVIRQVISQGEKVGVYPISEDQWADMGQLEEMEKMMKRFAAE